jgi:hypothetical protein
MLIQKIVFLVLSLATLASCGPKAKGDPVESQRFLFGYRQFFFTDKEIDPEVRSITLLTLPIEKDVVGFSYTPNREDWDFTFSSINHGHRVPFGVQARSSNFNKVSDLIYIVLASGDVRNASFERIVHSKRDQTRIIGRLNSIFNAHPCFMGLRPNHRSCFPRQSEGTVDTARFAESCEVLERWTWMEMSDEDEELLADNLVQCREVDGGRLQAIDELIAHEGDIRNQAKGIVLDLLSELEAHTGEVFVATGATKGEVDSINGHQSLIQMNADRTAFTQFQLAVDFNIGRGYQLFSLENGLIRDLELKELIPGVWRLTFFLDNDAYTLEAELSMDVQDVYDLRFSGDTVLTYKDGTVRKGLMKLELDFVE